MKILYIYTVLFSLVVFTSCTKKHTSVNKKDSFSVIKNSKVETALAKAKSYIGTKYKYGGNSSSGIDCSGLMCQSYKVAGIQLPRVSRDQANFGKRIYIGQLQKGDLIFFGATKGSKKVTHVGMISKVSSATIKFVHASSSKGVVESDFSNYYKDRYIRACRPIEK